MVNISNAEDTFVWLDGYMRLDEWWNASSVTNKLKSKK